MKELTKALEVLDYEEKELTCLLNCKECNYGDTILCRKVWKTKTSKDAVSIIDLAKLVKDCEK